MSSNVFFHAFCAGCGTEVADNGASSTLSCASCKPHIKEPESRIEIVINDALAVKDDVVVAVADVADVIDVVVASTTPISIVTEDEEWEDKQRAMRVLDDIEESKRNGEWGTYDDEYDEDDHYGCQCDNCAGYGDEEDGYADDGYGLDWNESGYFD